MNPQQTLKTYFGYDSFRPNQKSIIDSILNGTDTLTLLPTGGGKSICFQIPALMLPGITLVISPLLALIKDQVDQLKKRGIAATMLTSTLERSERTQIMAEIAEGKYKLVYLAPESLANQQLQQLLTSVEVALLVVDEAHCISEWGHDFRPSYREIAGLYIQFPKRPIIAAFTATATPHTVADILTSLQMKTPKVCSQTFQRDNLRITVFDCLNRSQQDIFLHRIIQKHEGDSGIIYVASRKAAEYLAKRISYFKRGDVEASRILFYHAGLDKNQREAVQNQFIQNDNQIVVATNAFGMGIDKSNIRFVIHYHFPNSLENYYQEIGRAGRDQQPAECYLLFNLHNIQIHTSFIDESNPELSKQNIGRKRQKLEYMIRYATTKHCRNSFLLSYFGQAEQLTSCRLCDNCTSIDEPKHQLLQALFSEQEKKRIALIDARRRLIAAHYKKDITYVLTDTALCYMALQIPKSSSEYLQIPGIGKGWVQKWGRHFADVLQ